MSAEDTKKRILDAAEHLFACKGFHKTSLRDITTEAGVNIASVNYHFGGREALVKAVVLRRLVPINRERMKRLEAIADSHGSLDVRAILKAFIEPSMDFLKSESASGDFVRIMGQGMAEPDETIRELFVEQVSPVLALMAELISMALPDIPTEVIGERLNCFLGAFAHWMRLAGNPDAFSGKGILSVSPEGMAASLLDFSVAGMEAQAR